MAPADSTSSPRDHAADANPDLARKKQRLSEDPGASPDSVIIEICEPEDIGTNMENAIEIEDDFDMEPYSHEFVLTNARTSAHEQVCALNHDIQQNCYIKTDMFIQISNRLTEHIERTAHDRSKWRQHYLDDEADFFTNLALLAINLLGAGDVFEPGEETDSPIMRDALLNLLTALESLCHRIIPHLPDAIKAMLSRRDSAQVSTRQQSLGGLYYVVVAVRILSKDSATVRYLQNYDHRLKLDRFLSSLRACFSKDEVVSSLAATISGLGGAMREVKESWIILHNALILFNVTTRARLSAQEYPEKEAETVLEIVNARILPIVCEKHPRALPENFHEALINFGGEALQMHVQLHDQTSAARMYQRFVKSSSDALIPEGSEHDSDATSLWRISGARQEVLTQLLRTSWSMQISKAFIYSEIMDIRTVGVSSLQNQLLHLFQQARSSPEGFEEPAVQLAIRFLRQNDIIAYIYGPESRAGLVHQSSDTVCFLAATSSYTNAETDTIWRACSTSVEADFVKASFGTLRKMIGHLDFEQLLHLVKKYSATPMSSFGTDAIEFLPDLLAQLENKSTALIEQAGRLALAFASIDILKHANSSEPTSYRDPVRHVSMAGIARFATLPFQLHDRAGIYEYCIPDIKNHTPHATTAVEVLNIMLNFTISAEEAQHILRLLSVSDAVEELCEFVRMKKEHHLLQSDVRDVAGRLRSIARLMSLSDAKTDASTQERLFASVFGEAALSNETRNAAWETLNSMSPKDDPPSAALGLWKGYMRDYVPALSASLATPRLIEFICVALKAEFAEETVKNDMRQLLHLPLWDAMIRFAITSTDDTVVHVAVGAIIDLLFVYPGETHIPPTTVARCHADFIYSHIANLQRLNASSAQSKELVDPRNFFLAINLLDVMLDKGRETSSLYAFAKDSDVLNIGDLEGTTDSVIFTAQVYGPEVQPKAITVHATESTKLSELLAKLPDFTGAVHNRVIFGGAEITEELDKTLFEAGIGESCVLLIRPKYEIGLDLDKVFSYPSPVEQAIVAEYSSLETLVDGCEETAHRTLLLLQRLRLPPQPRFKVVSATTTAQDLFPDDRRNRTKFSLFVLQMQLSDFARLGVADSRFILRAVHLLTEVLLDSSRAFDPLLLYDVFRTLSSFLREKPKPSEAMDYIQDNDRFTSRLIELLSRAINMSRDEGFVSTGLPLRTALAVEVYQTLLLACQTSDALWAAFTSNEAVVPLHTQLILDSDAHFSARMTQPIRNLCQDPGMSRDVPSFYWSVVMPGLSEALSRGSLSESYFRLAVDILHCEQDMQSNETWIRGLIERLTSELWSYQHMESAPLMIADKAMAGLLRLLWAATNILKSHKKPLKLPGVPTRLLRQLLLPQADEPQHRPLIQDETRALVYDLIRSTFTPDSDYQDLVDITLEAAEGSVRDTDARFPGMPEWIRPASNCAGLHNLGMTCYMNSLLQQLFANLQFRKFILEQPAQDLNKQDILGKVQVLFTQMQNGIIPVAQPQNLAAALNVQVGVQEDVHTFYTTLLSRLEDNMPDKESQSALTHFFTGKSVTQVKGDCGHVSSRTEPFTELSITVKNKASLEDSLAEFVQGEPLEGANKYMCMSCASDDSGRLVNAMKRTCLDEVPDSLTFCLKRFAFDSILEGENKVNDRFDFPPEIDMSIYKREYLENPEIRPERDMFELVGVIVHQGSLSYGHYWSYTRVPGSPDPYTGAWMYLEDTKSIRCAGGIREVQEQCSGGLKWSDGSERPESGYVLFYQRKGYISQAGHLNSVPKQLQLEHQILPMIDIPEQLANDINKDNLWRLKIASLFSGQFSSFVIWLLGQFSSVLETRQGQREEVDTPGETMTAIDSDSGELEVKVGSLIVKYAQHILLADPNGATKLVSLKTVLTTVLKERPVVAAHILTHFAENTFGFTAIVLHRSSKVRAQMFGFIETCLSCLRQQNPDDYNEVVAKVITAHASLLKVTLDNTAGYWNEYLAFAASFPSLGSYETCIVLDSGYLNWVFDALYLRWDPEARKRHPHLWNWLKPGGFNHMPLFEFLYDLFSGHVDLSEEVQHLAFGQEPRTETLSGWCLRQNEFDLLVKQKSANQRPYWLLFQAACHTCPTDGLWRDFAPGKLLGLLIGENMSFGMLRFIESMMITHFDLEENQLTPLLFMTLHYCLHREDQECKPLLKSLSKNLVLWEGQEKRSLWFFREAYKLAPTAVMSSVTQWAPHFLGTKGPQNRQATEKWLQDIVFAPPPLSEDSALDASRMRTTRTLVARCQGIIDDAYRVEEGRARYQSMLDTLAHANEYLRNLHTQVSERQEADEDGDAGLGPESVVEYGESRVMMASLQQFLDSEELKYWDGTSLPTRTLSVRRSVEIDDDEDEDLETSEADADEVGSELGTL